MQLPASVSRTLPIIVLAFIAYVPALDNGFIADDFDNLHFARSFLEDPGFLYTIPPQNFRMTTFLVMGIVDRFFPHQPAVLYLFSTLIHALNALLLYYLLTQLGSTRTEGWIAAAIFVVFQAPQEAVMWPSAVAEAMLGTCVLATLIFWVRGNRLAATTVYAIALFTKESAPVVLLLVVLVDLLRGQRILSWRYLWFVAPTAAFATIFWWVATRNPMVQEGVYALGPHAFGVLLRSLHRLVWPWLYVLVIVHRVAARRWIPATVIGRALGFVAVAMLPYIFVTYTNALPSRHVYVASMAFAAIMAGIVLRIPAPRFRKAIFVVFVVFNVSYLWIRKDSQFEQRAAPTTALLEVLEDREPTPVMIYNFAYPYPSIAKSVGRYLPGWDASLVSVDGADPECVDCLGLMWDPETGGYILLP